MQWQLMICNFKDTTVTTVLVAVKKDNSGLPYLWHNECYSYHVSFLIQCFAQIHITLKLSGVNYPL